jgi:3-phosphoglycerate kinase
MIIGMERPYLVKALEENWRSHLWGRQTRTSFRNFTIGQRKGVQIHIPVDVVAANAFSNDAETQIVDVNKILTAGKVLMRDQNH